MSEQSNESTQVVSLRLAEEKERQNQKEQGRNTARTFLSTTEEKESKDAHTKHVRAQLDSDATHIDLTHTHIHSSLQDPPNPASIDLLGIHVANIATGSIHLDDAE